MTLIFIVVAFILWVAPIWLATVVGAQRGRKGLGFALGFFLGWIGVLIVALLGPTSEAARTEILKTGFPCPFCREPVRQGATVCPHCQRDLPPSP